MKEHRSKRSPECSRQTRNDSRVIRETGEAFADYMDRNFRDLPCMRIEMDEQWQYVGLHGSRLHEAEKQSAETSGFGLHRRGHETGLFASRSESAIGGPAITFVEDVRNA